MIFLFPLINHNIIQYFIESDVWAKMDVQIKIPQSIQESTQRTFEIFFCFQIYVCNFLSKCRRIWEKNAKSINSIEAAFMVGGESSNIIDASTFPFAVQIDGKAGEDQITGSEFGDVLSGNLEVSNVKINDELTSMIRAQQAYSASSRMLQADADIVQKFL